MTTGGWSRSLHVGLGLSLLLLAPVVLSWSLGRPLPWVPVCGVLGLHTTWCMLESREQPELRWPCGRQERRIPTLAGAAILAATLLALWGAQPITGFRFWSGVALGALGVAIRRAAIRTLGTDFLDQVAWAPDQLRITTGVYRLRHPSELGSVAILVGTGLITGGRLALWALLFTALPMILIRILLEERCMAQAKPLRGPNGSGEPQAGTRRSGPPSSVRWPVPTKPGNPELNKPST